MDTEGAEYSGTNFVRNHFGDSLLLDSDVFLLGQQGRSEIEKARCPCFAGTHPFESNKISGATNTRFQTYPKC